MRNTHFISAVLMVVFFTACSRTQDCFGDAVFCAALVTDTQGVDDHGVNQSMWLGLQESEADHVAYIESVDVRDYEKNITKFLNDGYDLIITSGAGLKNTTLRYAELNPDSAFIGVNQNFEVLPANLSTINFAEDQAGFAAGYLAAKMTRTNIVGAACEDKSFDAMQKYCEGFRNGALYGNKDIQVLVEYRQGSREKLFIDSEWGKLAAQKLFKNGADVIFAAGGLTGQSVLEEAIQNSAYGIGTERDQWAGLAGSRYGLVTSFWGSGRLQLQRMMRAPGGESALGEVISAPYRDVYVGDELQKEVAQLLVDLQAGIISTQVLLQSP